MILQHGGDIILVYIPKRMLMLNKTCVWLFESQFACYILINQIHKSHMQLYHIPQCTTLEQKCAHFCSKVVHCGIWDRCIREFNLLICLLHSNKPNIHKSHMQLYHIPQCTTLEQKCAHFCSKVGHCGIQDRCIVGFVHSISGLDLNFQGHLSRRTSEIENLPVLHEMTPVRAIIYVIIFLIFLALVLSDKCHNNTTCPMSNFSKFLPVQDSRTKLMVKPWIYW